VDFLRCFLGFREIDFGYFEHHFRFDYGFYFFVEFADSDMSGVFFHDGFLFIISAAKVRIFGKI
jgi:hypothetical protein